MSNDKLAATFGGVAPGHIGAYTTRQLLQELQLRGDLAMTVFPTTPVGADGSRLSSIVGLFLEAADSRSLDGTRGEYPEMAAKAAEAVAAPSDEDEVVRQLDRRAERIARDDRRERLLTLQEFDDPRDVQPGY